MQLAGCNDGNNKISECFSEEEDATAPGPIKRALTSENYSRQSRLTSKLFRSIKDKFVGFLSWQKCVSNYNKKGAELRFLQNLIFEIYRQIEKLKIRNLMC